MATQGNVINFPLNEERNWHEIERSVRVLLTRTDAPDDLIDHICCKMKAIFLKHNKAFQINVEVPAGADLQEIVQEAAQQVVGRYQDIIIDLIGKIMVHEIDLYYKNEAE